VRLLLDTCVLLWWWSEPSRLSARASGLLRDPANRVLVSAASAWEIATKHRLGKLPRGSGIVAQWAERLTVDGFSELPIGAAHALRTGSLPGDHRDPFDRMLAAQSLIEGVPLLSPDTAIKTLGADLIW
jgi:PIN domain nuclease of toxin-antitoxin system